jgi:hypothetical protein
VSYIQSNAIYCDIKTGERAVTRLRHSKQLASITKIAHAVGMVFPAWSSWIVTSPTIEELLEAVFSVQSVLRLYNNDHLPSRDSLEAAVRRVGG